MVDIIEIDDEKSSEGGASTIESSSAYDSNSDSSSEESDSDSESHQPHPHSKQPDFASKDPSLLEAKRDHHPPCKSSSSSDSMILYSQIGSKARNATVCNPYYSNKSTGAYPTKKVPISIHDSRDSACSEETTGLATDPNLAFFQPDDSQRCRQSNHQESRVAQQDKQATPTNNSFKTIDKKEPLKNPYSYSSSHLPLSSSSSQARSAALRNTGDDSSQSNNYTSSDIRTENDKNIDIMPKSNITSTLPMIPKEKNLKSSTSSIVHTNTAPTSDKARPSFIKQQKEAPMIDPSLYKPPSNRPIKPDPIINYFSIKNRPVSDRKMIPVSNVFHPPISNFWKSKWHSFNHMQSELSNVLSHSDESIIVSAPTGAGKTCIFEMAMGRLFQNEMNNHQQLSNCSKTIYISPSKALCQERYNDWSKRLKIIHPTLECAMLTGDSPEFYSTIRDVENAHLILTTPEKWDLITRKWTNNFFLISTVKLILIDEVHFIGDVDRGACLEAVICRMKTVRRAVKAYTERIGSAAEHNSIMRVVAVSATLPNVVDIASFVDANQAFIFDSTYRPVPLTTHVVGLGYIGKNQFLFDKNLNRHIPDLINRFSQGRSTIIFCHTKKQTEVLATELLTSIGRNNPVLSRAAQLASLSSLKKCLGMGVAFHHAGMENDDRKLVEHHFSNGLVRCLCATSTLAMGVNLPAHLVIIKGTSVWRGAGQGYQELDSGTLLQMMGRAGRPGFDKSGTAVIMTDTKSKPRYEQLSSGLEVVESKLLKTLTETLNTEISQKVISSVRDAVDWIKGTYFFIRVRKNPKYYGVKEKDDLEIESYLMKKCVDSIRELCQSNIINLCDKGNNIEPRKASYVMSRHMIPFQGMKAIVALPHDSGMLQILHCLSNMKGIQTPVRRSEKSLLNDAHKAIKYKLEGGPPSKIRVQTPAQKAFVLLQAAIGQHYFNDFTLRQEMSSSIEFSSRVLSALEDYSVEESRHGQVALEALLLRRCLASSLWSANDGVLNQLRGVGAKSAGKLAMNNIRTFKDIMTKSSNEIEQACGRKSPFGQELKNVVAKIMSKSLKLTAFIEGLDCDSSPNELVCNILDPRDKPHTADAMLTTEEGGVVTYTLAVHTDRPHGSLMFRTSISSPCSHRIKCPQKFGRIYIHLVSNLIGLDDKYTIDGNDSVQKSLFVLPPQPQNLSVTKNAKSSKNSKSHQPNRKRSSTKLIENMVEGVQDFRLSKGSSNTSHSKVPTTLARKGPPTSVFERQVSPMVQRKRPHVTPSPPLQVSKSRVSEQVTKFSTSSISTRQSLPRKLEQKDKSIIREPNCNNMHIGSWQQQKKRQKRFQQRAFGSPKENPFSMFKFDPNSVEKQLEQQVSEARSDMVSSTPLGPNVFPTTSYKYLDQSKIVHNSRRSRFYSNVGRTPVLHSTSRFVGSTKRIKVGTSMTLGQTELLRQKAAEQQSYVMASRLYRTNQDENFHIEKMQQMVPNNYNQQSQIHDNSELDYQRGQYGNNICDSHPLGSDTIGNNFEMNQIYNNCHRQNGQLNHSQGVPVSPIPPTDYICNGSFNQNEAANAIYQYPNFHVDETQNFPLDEHLGQYQDDNHFFSFPSSQFAPYSSNEGIDPMNYSEPDIFQQQSSKAPEFFVGDSNQCLDTAMDDCHSHRNDSNMEGLVIHISGNSAQEHQPAPNKADDDFDLAFF